MHKEFRTGFELNSLDCIVFFTKEVHLFIGKGERRKVTLENKGTGGEGASRDGEGPPRALQVMESKNLLENSWGDHLQSPRRKQSAVNSRPSGLHRLIVQTVDHQKSRLSIDEDLSS